MSAGAHRRWALGAIVGLCALHSPPSPREGGARPALAAPAPAGSPEARGREIYARGASPSGDPIEAVIGAGTTVVPASTLPCTNCHGPEGRGRPEGGATPSDLRWESLRRPYEVVTPSGRRHLAYTDRLFGRAVTMGVDPAGNRLDDVMPRYRLSRADLADLLAYVKTLGAEPDPGITEAAIRIGALVPGDGPGRAARGALEAFFEEQNRRGGIYGRRIELRATELPAEPSAPEQQEEAARAFLDREQPFALAGVSLGAAEERIAALLEARGTPLVGAVSAHPPETRPLPRYLFYLAASPERPSGALAERSALAGARLLVEGLKRAGRELRREGLVDALEGVHDLQTGLMPPLSYGKNRRVGVLGGEGPRALPRPVP